MDPHPEKSNLRTLNKRELSEWNYLQKPPTERKSPRKGKGGREGRGCEGLGLSFSQIGLKGSGRPEREGQMKTLEGPNKTLGKQFPNLRTAQ